MVIVRGAGLGVETQESKAGTSGGLVGSASNPPGTPDVGRKFVSTMVSYMY